MAATDNEAIGLLAEAAAQAEKLRRTLAKAIACEDFSAIQPQHRRRAAEAFNTSLKLENQLDY